MIVIYRVKYNESSTVKSLCLLDSKRNINSQILLYDNSPNPQQIESKDLSKYIYVHNPLNGGLAEAYNHALSMIDDQDSWLLLLDQDSHLPPKYLDDLISTIKEITDKSIVAVAPHIICKNNLISPCFVKFGGKLKAIQQNYIGAFDEEIMAINSGFAVRTSFMKQIGGFNQKFWLDYLDHWLCRTIYAEGKKIYVNSSIINHSLSVSDFNDVSVQRAQNILDAEVIFYKQYKSKREVLLYIARLILRSTKQYIAVSNKNIAHYTLKTAMKLILNR